jgi:hypothetical protein
MHSFNFSRRGALSFSISQWNSSSIIHRIENSSLILAVRIIKLDFLKLSCHPYRAHVGEYYRARCLISNQCGQYDDILPS